METNTNNAQRNMEVKTTNTQRNIIETNTNNAQRNTEVKTNNAQRIMTQKPYSISTNSTQFDIATVISTLKMSLCSNRLFLCPLYCTAIKGLT